MFNWHQFRLCGLYGLQLLEVPTLTSLLCQFTLSGFGTLEGFQLLQVLTVLISLLCDPAWIDMHGFWCTVLLHEWCDQEGSPLSQRQQTNKNILSSAWKYNILTASFVIPLTSTCMTLPTKWVHYCMILEGRLTGYFNGRQARPMRTLLLDICTVFIEGSCFIMLSCHNATWSRAAEGCSLLFQACPAPQALTHTFTLICAAAACKREFRACSSTLLVRKGQFNQFSGSFKMAE